MDFHDPNPFSEQETGLIDMDPTMDINLRPFACVRHTAEELIESRKIGDMLTNSRSADRVANSLEYRQGDGLVAFGWLPSPKFELWFVSTANTTQLTEVDYPKPNQCCRTNPRELEPYH